MSSFMLNTPNQVTWESHTFLRSIQASICKYILWHFNDYVIVANDICVIYVQ